jgi:prepilin-type N-terminal cleavage/methylation domain-containing protein
VRRGVKANSGGFTLMEVLLTVAIITIITAVGAPVFLGLQRTNELDLATNTLAQYLYEAQVYSRAEDHDCQWGVTIAAQDLTLFCGNSYASRNTNYDHVYNIPSSIAIGQNLEIVYSKLYGLPATTGSYVLNAYGGQSSTVTVNPKGMVEY